MRLELLPDKWRNIKTVNGSLGEHVESKPTSKFKLERIMGCLQFEQLIGNGTKIRQKNDKAYCQTDWRMNDWLMDK